MTVSFHLRQAVNELLRAEELARTFNLPTEFQTRINLLRRGTVNVTAQLEQSISAKKGTL